FHPHLWAKVEDRQIPRSTQDHPQASLCQFESADGGASKTQTSVRGGAREMVEVRCSGIFQLSWCSWESGQPSKFSVTSDPALDVRATATQPEESDGLATTRGPRRALAPQASHPSSLSQFALRRQTSEVRAACSNPARADPCGGRQVNWRPYRDLKSGQLDRRNKSSWRER